MNIKVHIGNEIRKELLLQEHSVTWLANKVEHGDPSNLGKQLSSKHIKSELLFAISAALKKDFFAFYSQELSDILNPNSAQVR